MSLLNRYVDGAYAAWMGSVLSCCGTRLEDTPTRGVEKPMTILHHQPSLVPPPIPEPQHSRTSSHEWMTRTKSFASRASSRGSFSVRRKLNAYNGPRRPHIGAPTDFRHLENAMPRRTERFRPLELSIYMPENQLSPLLPHFGGADGEEDAILAYPAPALLHIRSESALSNFSIPRKPLGSHKSVHGRLEGMSRRTTTSSSGSDWISHPLRPRPSIPESPSTQELMAALQEEVPATPPQTRLRANTEPSRMINRDSEQLDRVKLALQERIELERQLRDIDSVIEERRSIYMSSRANSVYALSEEPMPDLTASELERIRRPKTAPSKPTVHIPVRAKSFTEASATFSAIDRTHAPLPPPLPLVLTQTRPPLRKKKSFSRVSNWLFPGNLSTELLHTRNMSFDSVTNTPKPVTSREGFYQCIVNNNGNNSTATVTNNGSRRTVSVSTVSTLESELDGPTAPTSWATRTPDSSPSSRRGGAGKEQQQQMELLTRMRTSEGEKEEEEGILVTREFGIEGAGLPVRISRVGVAF